MMTYLTYFTITLFIWLLRRFFFNSPKSPKTKLMKNKVVIITGSSAGLGRETAYDLLKNNATVVFACRDKKKTMGVISDMPIGFQTRSIFIKLDLCSIESIYKFVEEFKKQFSTVDILINNAGLVSNNFSLTEDNIETTMQANHIGHMVLTNLLINYFNTKEGRILNVSSDAHHWSEYNLDKIKALNNNLNYEGVSYSSIKESFVVYGNSKLANIYYTQYLNEVLESRFKHIKTASLHPGMVNTEISRYAAGILPYYLELPLKMILYPLFYYFSKTCEMGAQTTLYLCYEDFEILENGEYYQDCRKSGKSNNAKSTEMRDEFLKYSWCLIDKAIKGKFELIKF